jgi:ribosomal protein S12 methylthiotransferase
MKFHIISLGCSKNTADSEAVANRFAACGLQWVKEPEKADLLMVNTCGFITDAKEESLSTIMQALELKKKRPAMRTAVFGCLVKRYRSEIESSIPEIDYLYEFLSESELEYLIGLPAKA